MSKNRRIQLLRRILDQLPDVLGRPGQLLRDQNRAYDLALSAVNDLLEHETNER